MYKPLFFFCKMVGWQDLNKVVVRKDHNASTRCFPDQQQPELCLVVYSHETQTIGTDFASTKKWISSFLFPSFVSRSFVTFTAHSDFFPTHLDNRNFDIFVDQLRLLKNQRLRRNHLKKHFENCAVLTAQRFKKEMSLDLPFDYLVKF